MRGRRLAGATMTATLLALTAACGGAGAGGSSGGGSSGGGSSGGTVAGGLTVPDVPMKKKLGPSESQLNILAWPGYAEDGSTDPKIDWVTPFEKKTGCQVNVRVFGTSDEAVTLMKTGQYDLVSASGDASLRLVYGGYAAPVNTKLIPNYGELFDFLTGKQWNSVDGQSYGVPHGWGANLLMSRKDAVKKPPRSWAPVFEKNSQYAGKITAYDSPIYIADAAVYLMAHRPGLGIKNPYALDDKQLDAAVTLLKGQRQMISEYWSDYLKEVQAFKTEDSVLGTAWQVTASLAQSEGVPIRATVPKEGTTGWSDTWMISSESEHPNCAYRWMNYIVSPKVQAEATSYFGEAPANPKACALADDPHFCATYGAKDKEFRQSIWFWRTPISQCLDGRTDVTCTDYADWTQAWTEIQG